MTQQKKSQPQPSQKPQSDSKKTFSNPSSPGRLNESVEHFSRIGDGMCKRHPLRVTGTGPDKPLSAKSRKR